MQAAVKKLFRFEAAHSLPNHDGKCKHLHGHSYKAEIVARGIVNEERGHPKEGMVIDFADIKEIWNSLIWPLVDHQCLNSTLPIPVTTAERIAAWMLSLFVEAGVPVLSVTVWETETSAATALADVVIVESQQ